jgi:hypothetical protein
VVTDSGFSTTKQNEPTCVEESQGQVEWCSGRRLASYIVLVLGRPEDSIAGKRHGIARSPARTHQQKYKSILKSTERHYYCDDLGRIRTCRKEVVQFAIRPAFWHRSLEEGEGRVEESLWLKEHSAAAAVKYALLKPAVAREGLPREAPQTFLFPIPIGKMRCRDSVVHLFFPILDLQYNTKTAFTKSKSPLRI